MEYKCQKCGKLTEYKDDLHCRKLFLLQIIKLLDAGEIERAKTIFMAAEFDWSWKEQISDKIGGELKKWFLTKRLDFESRLAGKIAMEKHRKYLMILGIKDGGTTKSTKERNTHCFICKNSLSGLLYDECNICHWLVCDCGACGCGHVKDKLV